MPTAHLHPSSLTLMLDYSWLSTTLALYWLSSPAVMAVLSLVFVRMPTLTLMMTNEELAQNGLELAHSWRSQGAEACRFSCSPRLKNCPVEARKLFESSDFCGVLSNELPFADSASMLSPKRYFQSCVADSCFYDGYYSALCNSVASYAAACQVSQLPVRQWRSDTFWKCCGTKLCWMKVCWLCFGKIWNAYFIR